MIYTMQLTQFNSDPYCASSEGALIDAAKRGDLDAFNCIVLKYQDLLYRVAYRIFADEARAGDAVQDALISAFQHIQSFRDGSLKGWLIRIVVNKCGDHIRSARCRKAISLDAPLFSDSKNESDLYIEVKDTNLPVEARVENYELDNAIQAALNTIPLKFRAILILADIEEMNYEEIAKVLNIPVGTVKSRLARARPKLRSLLLEQQGLLPEKYARERA